MVGGWESSTIVEDSGRVAPPRGSGFRRSRLVLRFDDPARPWHRLDSGFERPDLFDLTTCRATSGSQR
jgi:hypothetical protein